ncbi:(2Fe-2S)-binding protein [Ochrobactrum oryzae]|uniref:(2Fe-2S)-binding protein n=1 Tax=Brucella oryzae TaxID=335286 RepID=UPI0016A4F9D0|nr:(2Fe-2S)-binding protein [Brucella oryzae]
MFRPINDHPTRDATNQSREATVAFSFDGRPMRGRNGDTLAASLLANGVSAFRKTPISGSVRGPYCLMGVCFECLVVVDGVGNRQACLTPLREGMVVKTQHGPRTLDALEKTRP